MTTFYLLNKYFPYDIACIIYKYVIASSLERKNYMLNLLLSNNINKLLLLRNSPKSNINFENIESIYDTYFNKTSVYVNLSLSDNNTLKMIIKILNYYLKLQSNFNINIVLHHNIIIQIKTYIFILTKHLERVHCNVMKKLYKPTIDNLKELEYIYDILIK